MRISVILADMKACGFSDITEKHERASVDVLPRSIHFILPQSQSFFLLLLIIIFLSLPIYRETETTAFVQIVLLEIKILFILRQEKLPLQVNTNISGQYFTTIEHHYHSAIIQGSELASSLVQRLKR